MYTNQEMEELSALGIRMQRKVGFDLDTKEGYFAREERENRLMMGFEVPEEDQPRTIGSAEMQLYRHEKNCRDLEDSVQELRRVSEENDNIEIGTINCVKKYDGGVDMEDVKTQTGRKDLVRWNGRGSNARYEFKGLILGQARNESNVAGYQMELSIEHPSQVIFIQFNERGIKLFVGEHEMDCKSKAYQTPDMKYKIREHLTYKNRMLSRVFVVIDHEDGTRIAFSHWIKPGGKFGPSDGWWGIDSRLS